MEQNKDRTAEKTPGTETVATKQTPLYGPDSWKNYIAKTATKVHKASAPVTSAEKWGNPRAQASVPQKETAPKAETVQENKSDPKSYAEEWKKYVPQTIAAKQKKTAPTYDADSWKQYVKPADTEKWKEYADKAKTAGAGYSANKGYILSLPACNDFNLFNFATISAPSGVKIHFRLPFPLNDKAIKKLGEQIKAANGTLEAE